MNNEQDWLLQEDEDDQQSTAVKYQYIMRPEPKEDLGPIYEIDDSWLGITQVREVAVGMVRNAKKENKKTILAYLKPFPHMRVDDSKKLQGWYKSKFEPKGVRPRPCFSESILTSPYTGYCQVGCTFSLPAGELIDTPNGPRPIESIKTGELVYGRYKGDPSPTKVVGTTKHWKSEGVIDITISDGRILHMTADHPVFCKSWKLLGEYREDGWKEAGSLNEGEPLEDIYYNEVFVKSIGVGTGRGIEVFDIQTESENFYQNGILVHNCYVNAGVRGYRGSGLITVPLHYGEQIRKQLGAMRRGAAGYFSSFTDPFLSLEDYYHNTQEASEEFVKVGLPIFYLSRLKYPDWAIELLTYSPYSYAQKSLNTGVPEDFKLLSPGALSLEGHYEDIVKIKKKGIYVSIQVNPIIPGVTSHKDIYRLFKRLAQCGTDHVIVKFVEASYSWVPTMVERMVKKFGERGEVFRDLFTDNQGGQKCVEEEYRLKAHKIYQSWATSLGMTYATCYEYRYSRDSEGKILDKTGVSIGREFTTAEQCHGQKEPMFTRDSEEELFREVEDCPSTGCLYCASENEGKPRCGDELAGEANALRYSDLKIPIGDGKARNESNPNLLQLGLEKIQ